MMFFHYKYLYEATGQRVGVGTYSVQINDPSQAAAVAKAIDAQFENSDAQTKTESEKAFLASFVALAGNLALLLNAIGLAVAFTILLVTANTMSMAVRERRTEIAVLKTLGFSSGLVMALILVEAVVHRRARRRARPRCSAAGSSRVLPQHARRSATLGASASPTSA